MNVFCPECGFHSRLVPEQWRCECGGAWEPHESPDFNPDLIDRDKTTIWRYQYFFGLALRNVKASLAVGGTPLLSLTLQGRLIWFKLDYFAPTGSFKDRGTELMINVLAEQGVTSVADDSSGNAGASLAAYAARAGMRAEIYVPSYASPAKQAQIAVYGAQVRPVDGSRANAKLAAWEAAGRGTVLASHAYHPGFLLGQQSVAWEIWEQLGQRAPDWFVVPVGQGVHLLGAWLGFRRLKIAGLIDRVPHMVGVQPTALAPVCQAFWANLVRVPGLEPKTASIAEGLAIAEPVRGKRLLEALRDSNGRCIAVAEDEILTAQRGLAHQGLYVEPTSATAYAALPAVAEWAAPDETIVVMLTGSGLKGSPRLP